MLASARGTLRQPQGARVDASIAPYNQLLSPISYLLSPH